MMNLGNHKVTTLLSYSMLNEKIDLIKDEHRIRKSTCQRKIIEETRYGKFPIDHRVKSCHSRY
jgi:hypothetical protein